MTYLRRRFLGPLLLIAASGAGLLLWLRYATPRALRHAAGAGTDGVRGHASASVASLLEQLADAVLVGLHVVAYAAGLSLALAVLLGLARLRARSRRAQPGNVLCAELRLGRDDQASPYEIGKVFDGVAGARPRPSPARWPSDADAADHERGRREPGALPRAGAGDLPRGDSGAAAGDVSRYPTRPDRHLRG
jgi:hypothetical protein